MSIREKLRHIGQAAASWHDLGQRNPRTEDIPPHLKPEAIGASTTFSFFQMQQEREMLRAQFSNSRITPGETFKKKHKGSAYARRNFRIVGLRVASHDSSHLRECLASTFLLIDKTVEARSPPIPGQMDIKIRLSSSAVENIHPVSLLTSSDSAGYSSAITGSPHPNMSTHFMGRSKPLLD